MVNILCLEAIAMKVITSIGSVMHLFNKCIYI